VTKKCSRTEDWVSKISLKQYRLERLRRIRDKKRRELERLESEITQLKKQTEESNNDT
jgi:hypothetical protein